MNLKSLSLATTLCASTAAVHNNLRDEHSNRALQLPNSLSCIIQPGKTLAECCPADGADDAICTLLTCANVADLGGDAMLYPSCNCGQIETACEGVLQFDVMLQGLGVTGLADLCGEVDTCCEAGTTANPDFNSCVSAATKDMEVPNFMAVLPAGLLEGIGPVIPGEDAPPAVAVDDMCSFCPDGLTVPEDTILPQESTCGMAQGYAATLAASDVMCTGTKMAEGMCCPPATPTDASKEPPAVDDTATDANESAKATTAAPPSETGATEAPPSETDATEAPGDDADAATDGVNGAGMYGISAAMSLVVSSVAMIFA